MHHENKQLSSGSMSFDDQNQRAAGSGQIVEE